jgi:hypothetical protein
MVTANTKTITLGPEYDDALRETLKAVLRGLGAIAGQSSWGVGGSQEVDSLVVSVEGQPLTVESETYVGLTITGNAQVVDKVAALVAQQQSKGPTVQ